jgi:thiol-disulfide isomerase/thioredoxin
MNLRLASAFALLALELGMATVHAEEKIRSFAPDSFRQIVAGHAGKPFVVMVWALDCAYCEPSFEALAEAKRKYKVSVVTIATDRADDQEAAGLITKKLKASGLASDTWAFGAAPEEQLRYAIDPKWRGEMPRSYWFNGRGEAVAYSGMISADTVSKLLPK